MEKKTGLSCNICKAPLEEKEVDLYYLGMAFHTTMPACPICGQVYISEELARGKAAQVEMQMEDK